MDADTVSVYNFWMNVLSVLDAYSFFVKKPSIDKDYCIDANDNCLPILK